MATYRVNGMSCQGCANSVTSAIKAIAPTAGVEVNLEAKTVSVEGLVDEAGVAQAVAGAGFEFSGLA